MPIYGVYRYGNRGLAKKQELMDRFKAAQQRGKARKK